MWYFQCKRGCAVADAKPEMELKATPVQEPAVQASENLSPLLGGVAPRSGDGAVLVSDDINSAIESALKDVDVAV